ncbi:enoyl-CoA hydratase/isomerase family protein [Solirubrobacter sp. CPCC 204708]|uniref:Enoyl-CoA hydratase/isomerase family protein n=1 Tax=Solirubrobacter deserti TaxID=2282478 RepID=A0ABT4RM13_9ACTN|nr:enoyl-CoA hydratase/isomerase family protein [Solirubrobacter deserti]MBE2314400.1 enoyl-CoA hydratase/isomerase family protein [Solirubrobacter deserti]MDA0139547.1 enoyl-CoA hydratase/isomerase family protein [Solirubrobacter deserti]
MSVEYERRGDAAWVTFNRPEAHNAMTFEMYDQLVEACDQVDLDDEVKVMVLRGAGGRAFVAGTDIRQFTQFATAQDGVIYETRIDNVLDRLEAVKKPTVALVEGFAFGSGFAIAACCDLRVMTPSATFGMPIARTVGNCLSMANYARLGAALGTPRLKDVIFRARPIEAEEALQIGFVSAVVEDAEGWAADLCTTLADHSPITMQVTKEALRRGRVVPEGEDLIRLAYGSEEFRTNVQRFLNR